MCQRCELDTSSQGLSDTMDLGKLDAAPGPRLTIQTAVPHQEDACESPDTCPETHASPKSSKKTQSQESTSLLCEDDFEGDAAFAGIPELKRTSTPVKTRFSYFQRMLWIDLPEDTWEDDGLEEPEEQASRGEANAPPKTGGINTRCGCYLVLLLTLSLLAVAGSQMATTPLSPIVIAPLMAKVVVWMALNLLGFGYVSRVTERRPWFLSRFGNYVEVTKVMLLAPIIFPLGPMWTIHTPVDKEVVYQEVLYNLSYYVLPFYFGLNWTHLQRWKPLRGVSASPAGIKQLMSTPQACVVVAAALPLVLGALGYHIHLIATSEYTGLYLGYTLGLVGGIVLTTVLVRRSHEIHLHHFFTTCVLIPLTSFDSPISAICQSLLAGIYIEGSARFGMGYFIDQWSRSELGYRTEWGCCCIPLH